jgi:hypothetical protein
MNNKEPGFSLNKQVVFRLKPTAMKFYLKAIFLFIAEK